MSPVVNDPTTASEEMYVEQELLLARLPARIAEAARAAGRAGLIEVVLDLGRIPTARYSGGREIALTESEVSEQDIDQVVSQVSEFGEDNRAGIPRTLHRISAIRNRRGRIVGLTCRIGRSVSGSASVIRDLIDSGKSVLLLGPPGVGKTTMLREAARVLADDLHKRVVIVDSSNEIGGDGERFLHDVDRDGHEAVVGADLCEVVVRDGADGIARGIEAELLPDFAAQVVRDARFDIAALQHVGDRLQARCGFVVGFADRQVALAGVHDDVLHFGGLREPARHCSQLHKLRARAHHAEDLHKP